MAKLFKVIYMESAFMLLPAEEDCINDGRHRKEISLMADCSSLFAISCFFSPFIPLVAHLNIGAYTDLL